MVNPNLRAIFTTGSTVPLSAEDIFTNRTTEVEAFRQSVRLFEEWAASDPSPVVDVAQARTNVLVYYGIGGIGKTALSTHLEQRLLQWTFSDPPPETVAIRIDFEDPTAVHLESFILRLRAGLGALRAKWPAFDLAFSVYWERAHPGEPLKQFLDNDSLLRRLTTRVGLPQQIQATIAELSESIGPPAALQAGHGVAKVIYNLVAQGITSRKLLSRCPFFKPLVEAEANDDTLSYLPSLLAWDLENLQRKHSAVAVVFLDTFEALANRATRALERFVQRAAFLMPNVLFVVTGRERLDWAELEPPTDLDYVGTARWPQLSMRNRTSEPRQHLVGFLSPADCDHYLRSVLSHDGAPVMDETIRSKITEASGGLPLYLDLSVAYYCDLLANGQTPQAQDFGGPLAAVVTRVMRDMDTSERSVLRGVCLLDSFDEDLARIAAGEVSDAVVADFVRRPFVQTTVDQPWPYALHTLLRQTIRDADHQLKDAWSPREWATAAERLRAYLGDLSQAHWQHADRSGLIACFLQGARLASEFQALDPWIVDAGNTLADTGVWSVLDLPTFGSQQPESVASALRAGFRGIALRRMGSLEDSIAHLETALASPQLTTHAAHLFVLHHAHAVRNSGRYLDAERSYRRIFTERGPFWVQAQVQVADIQLLRGHFRSALSILEQMPSDPFMHGEALRIQGHTYRANALFERAESLYRQAHEHAVSIESLAGEGKALTNLAETLCWHSPSRALVLADRALEFNRTVGNQLELIKAYAAKAIAEHGPGALMRAETSINASLELVGTTGYRAGAIFALTAHVFQLLIAGQDHLAAELASSIHAITAELDVYAFWTQVADWWLQTGAMRAGGPPSTAEWLEGPEEALARWCLVLQDRL